MTEKQITWIAQNPKGKLCGPCGTSKFVKEALLMGARRLAGLKDDSHHLDNRFWSVIKETGYKIRKCEVTIIE